MRRLLEEYREIGINWRYWGEVRFKQLTVFLLATGALGTTGFIRPLSTFTDIRLCLSGIGLVMTVAFLLLEERATYYRRAFMSCALAIEKGNALSQYRRTKNPWPTKSDGIFRFLFSTVIGAWVGYGLYQLLPKPIAGLIAFLTGAAFLAIVRWIAAPYHDLAATAGTRPVEATVEVSPPRIADEVSNEKEQEGD